MYISKTEKRFSSGKIRNLFYKHEHSLASAHACLIMQNYVEKNSKKIIFYKKYLLISDFFCTFARQFKKERFFHMQDIAIYGAGGHGREVACMLLEINQYAEHKGKEQPWNIVGFYDDGIAKGTSVSHYGKILGGINELNAYPQPLALVLAIGNPNTKKKIAEKIINTNITYPNIIHPTTWYADKNTFNIGKGNIIGGCSIISCDVKFGDFNLLNGFVNIGHDVVVGDNNTIMPGARISGEVKIGSRNLIGVGSIILQQIKIGDGVTLGAGGVLLTKPKNDSTYIGNPAKLLKY